MIYFRDTYASLRVFTKEDEKEEMQKECSPCALLSPFNFNV